LLEATRNKREGVPADIAEAVCFLASPGARHITGQGLTSTAARSRPGDDESEPAGGPRQGDVQVRPAAR
jgi:NAD(P)-dependent dehydrogenase (short-subunit alcohol dehydrogenase family)